MEAIRYTKDEHFTIRSVEEIEQEIKELPVGLGEYTTEELIAELEYRLRPELVSGVEIGDGSTY